MRIISGKYKGHHLVSFNADHIRPTTDRVKETLFNKLMFRAELRHALDLFCGTGNLGLEAISRGVEHVTFVDLSKKSIEITQKNIAKLKVPKEQYTIVIKDVLIFLKQFQNPPVDIIFVDPPFTKKMAHEVMLVVSQSKAFGANTILAIESESHEPIENTYGDILRFDAREYGDKTLSFFSKKQGEGSI